MRTAKLDDAALLDLLLGVFRRYGYEGASLSLISTATGLQRASLYHRFPGGKPEMAEAVLGHVQRWVADNIVEPLQGDGEPAARLKRMCRALDAIYEGGSAACLTNVFSFHTDVPVLRERVASGVERWLTTLAKLSRESGASSREAKQRAEDALVSIQGALVVSRASGDSAVFKRALRQLPSRLLADPGS